MRGWGLRLNSSRVCVCCKQRNLHETQLPQHARQDKCPCRLQSLSSTWCSPADIRPPVMSAFHRLELVSMFRHSRSMLQPVVIAPNLPLKVLCTPVMSAFHRLELVSSATTNTEEEALQDWGRGGEGLWEERGLLDTMPI